jgi:hypothetical protein
MTKASPDEVILKPAWFVNFCKKTAGYVVAVNRTTSK